jgi:hypothetical protein
MGIDIIHMAYDGVSGGSQKQSEMETSIFTSISKRHRRQFTLGIRIEWSQETTTSI